MNITRLNTTALWSDATLYNGIAHFVEVPADTRVDFQAQLQQLLSQAEQTLASIGSSTAQLLSATIYLTDRANVAALNEAWQRWLPAGFAPSRACVKTELLDTAMLVEIAFVAAYAA